NLFLLENLTPQLSQDNSESIFIYLLKKPMAECVIDLVKGIDDFLSGISVQQSLLQINLLSRNQVIDPRRSAESAPISGSSCAAMARGSTRMRRICADWIRARFEFTSEPFVSERSPRFVARGGPGPMARCRPRGGRSREVRPARRPGNVRRRPQGCRCPRCLSGARA